MSNGKERIQLNLRLDGHKDLYEAVKVAASEQDTSVNQFVVDALKVALGWEDEAVVSPQVSSAIESRLAVLESRLAVLESRLAAVSSIEKRLGKIEQQLGKSIVRKEDESLRQSVGTKAQKSSLVKPPCPACGGVKVENKGLRGKKRRWICSSCHHYWSTPTEPAKKPG